MNAKDKFLLSFAAKPFSEMAAKPEFEAALDAAMLKCVGDAGIVDEPQAAMAWKWRLEGARKFSEALKGMATMEKADIIDPTFGQMKGNV